MLLSEKIPATPGVSSATKNAAGVKITGEVTLPGEVTGRLDVNGQILTLTPGQNQF